MTYYLNVKGVSVKPFETAMQKVARLIQMIITNLKVEKKPIPESIGDIIWKISFTLYPELRSGTWQMGFKDFKVMTSEDAAEFGQILEDINTRRTAGQLQSQEASEQEEEAAALTGQPAGNRVRQAEVVSVQTNEVAKQNAQIQI